jgi:GNAT superfamily N-acetyltransferase
MMRAANALIRRAVVEDAPALAALLRALERFDWLHAEPPVEALARVRGRLERAAGDDSHSIYVAVGAAGELAGYAAVHWLSYFILPGPEGFVSELFLLPEARGRGIGSRLLDAVVEEARARGCSRLSLLNNRRRESYERGFYAGRGWQERADMANFVLFLDR